MKASKLIAARKEYLASQASLSVEDQLINMYADDCDKTKEDMVDYFRSLDSEKVGMTADEVLEHNQSMGITPEYKDMAFGV